MKYKYFTESAQGIILTLYRNRPLKFIVTVDVCSNELSFYLSI